MSKPKKKYYVVWRGFETGVFETWGECEDLTSAYPGAKFKAYPTREEAEAAFAAGPPEQTKTDAPADEPEPTAEPERSAEPKSAPQRTFPPEVQLRALAVDAACSGNPGPMEYRGVYLANGQEKFHFGPIRGTNNIGEFLAIVHALALLDKFGITMPVYSDSWNALRWVRARHCRSSLERNESTEEVWQLIHRAENWLREHDFSRIPLIKWETRKWGEVPADFGRKK